MNHGKLAIGRVFAILIGVFSKRYAMKAMLIAMFCLFGYSISKAEEPKAEEAKKPQICWEAAELYNDSDFKEKLPKDSWMYKKAQKKMPKYEKMVKKETEKILAEKGMELVECPKHKTAGSGLKQVTEEDKPLHMKILLSYEGVFTITVYVKVEVYRGDEKVITFRRQKSATIFEGSTKEKRRVIITKFGREIAEELAQKVKELKPEEK